MAAAELHHSLGKEFLLRERIEELNQALAEAIEREQALQRFMAEEHVANAELVAHLHKCSGAYNRALVEVTARHNNSGSWSQRPVAAARYLGSKLGPPLLCGELIWQRREPEDAAAKQLQPGSDALADARSGGRPRQHSAPVLLVLLLALLLAAALLLLLRQQQHHDLLQQHHAQHRAEESAAPAPSNCSVLVQLAQACVHK